MQYFARKAGGIHRGNSVIAPGKTREASLVNMADGSHSLIAKPLAADGEKRLECFKNWKT